MKNIVFVLSMIFFWGCEKDREDLVISGYAPVYVQFDVTKIKSEKARTLKKGSNFVIYKSFILIVEQGEGIHIVDNQFPANPVFISFIPIPSINHLTASEDILYVNVGFDLVLIDISDIRNVQYQSKVSNFFETEAQEIPSEVRGYFECVDYSKGLVIKWETKTLVNPRCRTIN
jgi:hypothetical protein